MNKFIKDNSVHIAGLLVMLFVGLLPYLYKESGQNKIAIIPIRFVEMDDYWLPSGIAKINVGNKNAKIEDSSISYFLIKNMANSPIETSDFLSPITFRSNNTNVKIVSAQSCTEKYNNHCSPDNSIGSGIESKWTISPQGWKLEPTYINAKDYVCVAIIFEKSISLSDNYSPFTFEGKIKNSKITMYKSLHDYHEKTSGPIRTLLSKPIFLSLWDLYAFVLFTIIGFYSFTRYALIKNYVSPDNKLSSLHLCNILMIQICISLLIMISLKPPLTIISYLAILLMVLLYLTLDIFILKEKRKLKK